MTNPVSTNGHIRASFWLSILGLVACLWFLWDGTLPLFILCVSCFAAAIILGVVGRRKLDRCGTPSTRASDGVILSLLWLILLPLLLPEVQKIHMAAAASRAT